MADAAAKLAAKLADLERRLAAMERGQQIQHSTIEVNGEEVILPEAVSAGMTALSEASLLDDRLSTAEDDLTASSARLDAAEADILDAFGRADAAQSTANDAETAASAAQTAADNAHAAADDAATAAANAAGIADSKGKALIQSTAPAAADQNAVTLWIDTTGGANTPKRWNGSAWVAVTDKAATDAATAAANAASAASAADAKAVAAQTAAGNAQTTANNALTMAGSKGKVFYDTAAPSGTGTAAGDLWRRIDASKNVIGEWYWTGSAWQSSQITTDAISNLDVGKLTAGSAAILTVTAQKIAASTAAFQTVDVKNLFATTGTLDTAVINKLWTDVVNSRKITSNMIAVGDFTNLIDDGEFETVTNTPWTLSDDGVIQPDSGRGNTNALRCTNSSLRTTGVVATQTGRRLKAGDKFFATARIYRGATPTADTQIRMVANYKTITGAANGSATLLFVPAGGAGGWQLYSSAEMTVPASTESVDIQLCIDPSFTASVVWDAITLTKKVSSVVLEDGAVTAEKLESQLVLASEVIAGDPAGNHAKLDQNGFRVMAPPADGAAPAEVIRLGTETDDYFGVVGADGNLTASITGEGGITAKTLDISDVLTLSGDDLGSRIDYMPQPLVAWGQVPIDTTTMTVSGSGGVIGLFEIGWDSNQPAGRDARMYLFNLNNVLIRSTAVGQIGLRLHLTTDGTAPTVNSPVIQYSYGYVGVANGYASFNINRIIGSNNGDYLRVLVSLWNGTTGTASVLKDGNQAYLYTTVTDLGQTRTPNAVASTGGGSSAPAPVTTTKEWKTTGTKSYTGSGAFYNYNTGYMYSGLSPAGYGDLRSVAVFPSLTSTLSGATINDIWIYVYYDFWYYGSGGTAAISLHGYSSLPASSPSLSYSMSSSGWPRAAGRWVRLPDSTYAGFKSGTWKGFGLGGHGGGYTEYGYAHDARIKIRYTK